ncbi:MAG: 4-hydroxy-tetrahydrodipicolinate reductase [Candidatus Omnitrophica bacterium ADurb.Bin277]|nr:MAG: 4-hydroxy-tetrahydrodipicolinate reductase [Candidatus Omnitrophica bacterium ADurb.Bin277]
MIRLAVAGAAGRMGKMILQLALKDKSFKITGGTEQRGHTSLGTDIGSLIGSGLLNVQIRQDPVAVLKTADVFVDFSHFSALPENLAACFETKTAYVIGTTAIPAGTLKKIKQASKKIPIVQSPNMSVGVNLLFRLAALAGSVLDESYDLEITEVHHRMKKDAPSGTALKLLEILAEARGRSAKRDVVYGREGNTGVREKGKIGVFALRGGDVIGEHTVSFLGDGERFELVHKASSREAFAKGALLAAKFLAKKKAGLYHMGHVLDMTW